MLLLRCLLQMCFLIVIAISCNVLSVPLQLGADRNDCGLYTIAFAMELAFSHGPVTKKLNRTKCIHT